jgi:hypothetical protein
MLGIVTRTHRPGLYSSCWSTSAGGRLELSEHKDGRVRVGSLVDLLVKAASDTERYGHPDPSIRRLGKLTPELPTLHLTTRRSSTGHPLGFTHSQRSGPTAKIEDLHSSPA